MKVILSEPTTKQNLENATRPRGQEKRSYNEGLENKIKDHEAALEKKNFVLQTMEGSLAEAQAEIARLNSELSMKSKSFEQEKKDFETKLEAEVEKSSNL
jgi:chromosome segregation ATPase